MLTIITLPNANDLFTSLGASADGTFTNYLPIALFVLGIPIASIILKGLIDWITHGTKHITGKD